MARYDNTDFSTFPGGQGPDLDPSFTPIPWQQAVAERVVRRWLANKGTMHDANYGTGIGQWLKAEVLPGDLDRLASVMRDDALQEDGVVATDVRVDLQGSDEYAITAEIEIDDGIGVDLVLVLSRQNYDRISLLEVTFV